jgi:hypothetical protein
MYYG